MIHTSNKFVNDYENQKQNDNTLIYKTGRKNKDTSSRNNLCLYMENMAHTGIVTKSINLSEKQGR
jgi:hypothetical protein